MSRTCHAPNIDILVHGDDEAVHDDRGDDGSVAAGEKDHHFGDEGVLHRTLNDSAHEAETSRSAVGTISRHHQETDKIQRKKIRTEFGRNRPSMVCHRCGRKEISWEGCG